MFLLRSGVHVTQKLVSLKTERISVVLSVQTLDQFDCGVWVTDKTACSSIAVWKMSSLLAEGISVEFQDSLID